MSVHQSPSTTTTLEGLLDLDSLLSAEDRDLRTMVREFGEQRLRPHVAEWFDSGRVPVRELALEIGKLGLLGMHLTGYGCGGSSATAYGLVCQELEAVDSGLRSLVSVQGSLAMYAIHRWGSEEQRAQWLPGMAAGELIGCFGLTEPDYGSNPGGMRTTARRDGSDWILNGSKMWITNASVADVAVIWARSKEGVVGFAVPTSTPGLHATEMTRKLSLRASVTSEIHLDDVRVPEDARLPEAAGLKAPLSCLSEARFGIVFGAVGAARDCLEATLDYVGTRAVFDRPLSSYQLTQAKIADMAVELGKAQLLALHLGRLKDSGRIRPEQVSVGKLNNVREAIEIARQCRTLLGANGITLEYPVLRHANNLESVLTYEGTSEVHQLVIGEALTGVSAFR
ncbi:acyl-CoA dehydrogenase family protein [Mycolicibacterium vaccae]|uniref:Acyl-CoA dehydrogenase domain-containing protein n=1 Tax=Mycolicibacterium vaccae ATCC 25954 TaxID=1194972 RepID=K0VLU5_MYCVA|nr:acyl-CoA dehydrogenase family protein [Mycolicibacterium vaccae]ANI41585.1 acyl-CoA dehydrogenase [Mycolicibacterium vaccae 95051]EJZ12094.1 acyl-CoA dehydrogenase domain-containing protein [Mycolicibacterium vaccae ATCC 25954]MCV7062761.1 acyl-CoA dehydrogenase family protein [Mycolicibacterium vaccae]